ncbi:homoserine O-acetyltransferase MetX [Humidisolicoccus flavus]|uniref:homoserine O-acetyltransferase MetX n=1 Tax=Humidisolicoccus flavus TaxID=3111414 RepID=UPI00324EA572
MDWQQNDDVWPSARIPESMVRLQDSQHTIIPVTGAWRPGDDLGNRSFVQLEDFTTERGATIPQPRIAFETWGSLNADQSNAVLVFHALTGDSHLTGPASAGHKTAGWWPELVGPGKPIDTEQFYVVAPNVLGGCQGSSGPASPDPDGREWGSRFPSVTIRDQVNAAALFSDAIGIDRWHTVVGGSVGGMHALEWAISFPERVERLAVLAAPARSSADTIAFGRLQHEAVTSDPFWLGGDYYDQPAGSGPHRGLALARRIALLTYRAPVELNERFERLWQSARDPLDGGRYQVESYLDFHGNTFTRRFDAGSYIRLLHAMNSHDVGRDRGGIEAALRRVTARSLVLGIDSDRLFGVESQREIAGSLQHSIHGPDPVVIESEFGHDGFLIETQKVGRHLTALIHADEPTSDALPI